MVWCTRVFFAWELVAGLLWGFYRLIVGKWSLLASLSNLLLRRVNTIISTVAAFQDLITGRVAHSVQVWCRFPYSINYIQFFVFLSTKSGWTVAINLLVKTHDSFSWCWGQKSGGTGAQGLGRPQAGLLICFSLHFFTILQIYHTLRFFFFADSCHLSPLHSIAWILFISSLANPNGPACRVGWAGQASGVCTSDFFASQSLTSKTLRRSVARHARSIWGMASVETTATSKPLWFGSAEGATEQVPVANGQADLSRSFKYGFDVKAISQVCQFPFVDLSGEAEVPLLQLQLSWSSCCEASSETVSRAPLCTYSGMSQAPKALICLAHQEDKLEPKSPRLADRWLSASQETLLSLGFIPSSWTQCLLTSFDIIFLHFFAFSTIHRYPQLRWMQICRKQIEHKHHDQVHMRRTSKGSESAKLKPERLEVTVPWQHHTAQCPVDLSGCATASEIDAAEWRWPTLALARAPARDHQRRKAAAVIDCASKIRELRA